MLASAGVLMSEVLLTRIFSFTVWYHLAYLTISTALLGFAAAGTLLAVFPALVRRWPDRTAAIGAAAAGVGLIVSLAVLGPRPLRTEELLGAPGSFFFDLLGYYSVVTVPFLAAGLAIAVPLTAYAPAVNRLYATDLVGAGIGCLLAVGGLTWLSGEQAVFLAAVVLLAAGAFYAPARRTAVALGAVAVVALVALPWAAGILSFVPTGTKALAMSLEGGEVEILETRWSPVNRVDLFRDGKASRGGFWAFFGKSKRFSGPYPEVLHIQYDGHNGSNILRVGEEVRVPMLDGHLLSTPYEVRPRREVLVIGVGGGIDVVNALHHRATRVTGVELQPITVELLQGRLREFTHGVFTRPDVQLVAGEGRHYVRSHDRLFDLIQITAVDTFSAQTTGAYVLAESYLYTVEAFRDYLSHLEDEGLVSVVVGDPLYDEKDLPPPLGTRLALVARTALEEMGVADPTRHLMIVAQAGRTRWATERGSFAGSWTHDLLVKKTPFTHEEVARASAFARDNGFEVLLSPAGEGLPSLVRLVAAPAGDLGERLDESPFELHPVRDEKPFFFNVQRWRALLTGDSQIWYFPGSATGQAVLLMMLVQAVLLGSVLVLLPLWRRSVRAPSAGEGRLGRRQIAGFLTYFLALGLGFMLIEISFVQKYVLLLGYPTYSLSVTIFSLLVFAGVGAALSRRGWGRPRRFLGSLLVATCLLVAAEVVALPVIREAALGLALGWRVAITMLLQLPLGLALGMYFPTGIELLRREDEGLIAWGWAVNGVASVAAAVLAVIVAMEVGFTGVAALATAIYIVGTLTLLGAVGPTRTTGA